MACIQQTDQKTESLNRLQMEMKRTFGKIKVNKAKRDKVLGNLLIEKGEDTEPQTY